MEFPVTINSQDEFDGLVKIRLERERAKFADYDEVKARADAAEAEKAQAEQAHTTALAEAASRAEAAESRVGEFEREKQVTTWREEVAQATGVPSAALRGSTKEEFEAHAQTLKPLITGSGPVIPNQGDEPTGSTVDHGVREFADFLTGHRTD